MKERDFTHRQLQALHRIALELGKPGELDDAIKKSLKLLAKHLQMERGMVSILRRDLNEIHTLAADGIDRKNLNQSTFAPGEGITGKVINTGRPIAVPSMEEEPMFLDRSGLRKGLDQSELAFLCVPIKYGRETVGSLSVDRVSDNSENLEEDLQLLRAVGKLLAPRLVSRRISEENRWLRQSRGTPGGQMDILGNSEIIRNVRYLIAQVADSKATVLLTGETGTGKGLVARVIHKTSPRKSLPFIHINCGSIPEQLVESELFGHERGAFTGADKKRIGRFEAAGSGTIFLDEINELPGQAQVKLLRILQDRQFERVGGSEALRSNARIIAATNSNLEKDVTDGRFRPDLYYRLNIFPIHVPPLRERGADVLLLADHFTKIYSKELDKNVVRIDTPAIDMLMAYHWPGNVRELENAVERAVLLAKEDVLTAHLLPPSLQIKAMEGRTKPRGKLTQLVEAYEMELIVDALKDAGGNQTKAARLLGTSKRIVQYKISKYNVDWRKFK